MYIICDVDMVKTVKRSRGGAWIVRMLLAVALSNPISAFEIEPGTQAGPADVPAADVLKRIYVEVKDLGPYPGETFIKHDFFLGPADDDSYKREHIVVLIQDVGGVERMRIQVTEMKSRPDDPRIQLAGKTRTITCSVSGGEALTLLRTDYSDTETVRLAPDILRAVREKKKLLDEYKAKPSDRG
jgi:hypothetical protein